MEALANLAHELARPVQAILGYLDILRDELSEAVDDRHKQIIARMNANAHDLAQTVENVHGLFGRGRDGGSAGRRGNPPADLMRDLAPALEAANGSKGLEIRFDLEARGHGVRSRRRPIKTILLNLAINAIKFTDQGSVTIAIRPADRLNQRAAIELEVRDTGPGIDCREWSTPAFKRVRSACALEYSQVTAEWAWAWLSFSAMSKRSAQELSSKSELPQGSVLRSDSTHCANSITETLTRSTA